MWTSESMDFVKQHHLNDHIIELGPYTLVTVNEGYSAVTQNNGKQVILAGGHTHFLTHKNWKFEKFITLKIQTDEFERIKATSADNINMLVNSTVNWRIVDVEVARRALMAAETVWMAQSGKGKIAADIIKLRRDVLKQALASLAAFIGSVNYSESFHMSLRWRRKPRDGTTPAGRRYVGRRNAGDGRRLRGQPALQPGEDGQRPSSTLIVSARTLRHRDHVDQHHQCGSGGRRADEVALASGAVASAEALMAETTASRPVARRDL